MVLSVLLVYLFDIKIYLYFQNLFISTLFIYIIYSGDPKLLPVLYYKRRGKSQGITVE